jgi:hypothetical protein
MSIAVSYPTNAELQQVAQDKLPNLMANRPIFQILPIRNVDAALLIWEQKDNYLGLQQVRGLNGDAPRVKRTGAKRYIMEPGVYGEFENIDEAEITLRRPLGQFTGPVPIDDLIMECQDKLLARRLDRIEYIGWQLLQTGTFSVSGPNGTVLHTDSFAIQTASRAVDWDSAATATPLADFHAVQLLAHGHSVSFGPQSKAYMNQATFNKMAANTNAADLYGRRTQGFGTPNTRNDINVLFVGEGLPQIEIYDLGYLDDAGSFQPWIADDKVIFVGQCFGNQVVGEYLMTRNANNPNAAPGAYQKVIDDENEVPRHIEVHDGHNGGGVLYMPSAVVVLSV